MPSSATAKCLTGPEAKVLFANIPDYDVEIDGNWEPFNNGRIQWVSDILCSKVFETFENLGVHLSARETITIANCLTEVLSAHDGQEICEAEATMLTSIQQK